MICLPLLMPRFPASSVHADFSLPPQKVKRGRKYESNAYACVASSPMLLRRMRGSGLRRSSEPPMRCLLRVAPFAVGGLRAASLNAPSKRVVDNSVYAVARYRCCSAACGVSTPWSLADMFMLCQESSFFIERGDGGGGAIEIRCC